MTLFIRNRSLSDTLHFISILFNQIHSIKFSKSFFIGVMFILIGTDYIQGQVTVLKAWSNVYHDTGNYSDTYTLPTGTNSNQVLIVDIST